MPCLLTDAGIIQNKGCSCASCVGFGCREYAQRGRWNQGWENLCAWSWNLCVPELVVVAGESGTALHFSTCYRFLQELWENKWLFISQLWLHYKCSIRIVLISLCLSLILLKDPYYFLCAYKAHICIWTICLSYWRFTIILLDIFFQGTWNLLSGCNLARQTFQLLLDIIDFWRRLW